MGHILIKQNNGNYCIYSSCVDCTVGYDATKEELINFYLEEAKERVERDVERMMDNADNYKGWNNDIEFELKNIKKKQPDIFKQYLKGVKSRKEKEEKEFKQLGDKEVDRLVRNLALDEIKIDSQYRCKNEEN